MAQQDRWELKSTAERTLFLKNYEWSKWTFWRGQIQLSIYCERTNVEQKRSYDKMIIDWVRAGRTGKFLALGRPKIFLSGPPTQYILSSLCSCCLLATRWTAEKQQQQQQQHFIANLEVYKLFHSWFEKLKGYQLPEITKKLKMSGRWFK